MVDAVGGVDIDVARPLSDQNYGGFGVGPGWSITAGPHHLDGANALAYARIRKSAGESDFTRAGRQQEVLIALRDRPSRSATSSSACRPSSMRSATPSGRTCRRNGCPSSPPSPRRSAAIGRPRSVMTSPMVKSGGKNHQYGSVVIPVPKRIAEMVAIVFTAPGTPPGPWPPPKTSAP